MDNQLLQELKRKRLEKGLTIAFIANDLNIRKNYLEAIEEGNLGILPGKVYTEGYIKLYSNYLGISIVPKLELIDSKNSVFIGTALSESASPSNLHLVLSIVSTIVVGLLYNSYYNINKYDSADQLSNSLPFILNTEKKLFLFDFYTKNITSEDSQEYFFKNYAFLDQEALESFCKENAYKIEKEHESNKPKPSSINLRSEDLY